MNTEDLSPVNEWNYYHHDYVARPLRDSADFAGDWTNGMTAHLPLVSNRSEQGRLQDRTTRLLMAKQANDRRKIRV